MMTLSLAVIFIESINWVVRVATFLVLFWLSSFRDFTHQYIVSFICLDLSFKLLLPLWVVQLCC